MDFNATFGQPKSQRHQSSGGTGPSFLIIGNFLGSSETAPEAALPLGMENFFDAFESLAPQLEIEGEPIQFFEIEDFHPDQLLRKVSGLKGLFEQYQSLRSDGKDSIFFKALAGNPPKPGPKATETASSEIEDVFGELLGGERPERADPAPSPASPQDPAVEKLIESALRGSEQSSDQDLDAVASALRQAER